MNRMSPGRGWAYGGLLLGLIGSITGNVASTVLAVTDIPLQLRVPFAVGWPVWTWVGIEVLTRTQWRRHWTHWIARLILMGPTTLVAASVSYLHLNHIMGLAGEPGLAQIIGPLAIDGTLFGCTVALLVTRRTYGTEQDPGTRLTLAERVSALRATAIAVKDAATKDALEDPKVPDPQIPITNVPVVPRQRTSVSLRGSWDVAKVVRMVLEGHRDTDIAAAVGVGPKQVQRVRRAVGVLMADPAAQVPAAWKVPAAAVAIIRQEVTR